MLRTIRQFNVHVDMKQWNLPKKKKTRTAWRTIWWREIKNLKCPFFLEFCIGVCRLSSVLFIQLFCYGLSAYSVTFLTNGCGFVGYKRCSFFSQHVPASSHTRITLIYLKIRCVVGKYSHWFSTALVHSRLSPIYSALNADFQNSIIISWDDVKQRGKWSLESNVLCHCGILHFLWIISGADGILS